MFWLMLTIGVLDFAGPHGDNIVDIISKANPKAKIVRINFNDRSIRDNLTNHIDEYDRLNLSWVIPGMLREGKYKGPLNDIFKNYRGDIYAGAGNHPSDLGLTAYPASDVDVISVATPTQGTGDIIVKNVNGTSWACAVACALGLKTGTIYGHDPVEIIKFKSGHKRTHVKLRTKVVGLVTFWLGPYRFIKNVKKPKRRFSFKLVTKVERMWIHEQAPNTKDH